MADVHAIPAPDPAVAALEAAAARLVEAAALVAQSQPPAAAPSPQHSAADVLGLAFQAALNAARGRGLGGLIPERVAAAQLLAVLLGFTPHAAPREDAMVAMASEALRLAQALDRRRHA